MWHLQKCRRTNTMKSLHEGMLSDYIYRYYCSKQAVHLQEEIRRIFTTLIFFNASFCPEINHFDTFSVSVCLPNNIRRGGLKTRLWDYFFFCPKTFSIKSVVLTTSSLRFAILKLLRWVEKMMQLAVSTDMVSSKSWLEQ